ncbi:MAG: type II toxin-antitoxin system prevent-host-death family antitoxin [Burkholderiales bacterium]
MSASVNVTQLRQNLPDYLRQVQEGHEVEVTVRGKVIARIVPEAARSERAKKKLAELRKTAKLGDVTAPTGATWTGDRDHL